MTINTDKYRYISVNIGKLSSFGQIQKLTDLESHPHCGEEPEYSTIKSSNLQTQYISFIELDHFHGYGPCMIFLIPPRPGSRRPRPPE